MIEIEVLGVDAIRRPTLEVNETVALLSELGEKTMGRLPYPRICTRIHSLHQGLQWKGKQAFEELKRTSINCLTYETIWDHSVHLPRVPMMARVCGKDHSVLHKVRIPAQTPTVRLRQYLCLKLPMQPFGDLLQAY